jgi:hypothetical protein
LEITGGVGGAALLATMSATSVQAEDHDAR